MKERILQVMADVDANKLLDLIDDDIAEMSTLATDAEITRQFETIQGELEGILKSWMAVKMEEMFNLKKYDRYTDEDIKKAQKYLTNIEEADARNTL